MKLTFRIWLLIAALILALLVMAPWKSLENGVVIKSVEKNSSALEAGIKSGAIILEINNQPVNNLADYSRIVSSLFQNNESQRLTIKTKQEEIIFLASSLDITVSELPNSNIKTGLDLSGGARAIVRAENVSLTSSQLNDLISVLNNRLNAFGLSDISVRSNTDLFGEKTVQIEIAGATPSDLEELVGKQGKFEAKIGNETVFIGGDRDISDVCRTDASCSRIESCFQTAEGYACRFSFVVYLSEEAAQRHADITKTLGLNTSAGRYLDKNLDLYLDDILVDTLLISEDLKGRVTTQISISGSGSGATREEAYNSARNSMKKLQTILITGSLPYKLEIVKLDTLSPNLGKQFTENIILLAVIVFVIISAVLFIRYRKIKITGAVILTMFSEAVITLGIAALIKWNLDAPSIAGIIAGMGTGVNDQIVMIDESISSQVESMGTKIKRAFFIILGAFFTIIAAMIPLYFAGAGTLKGFAITTIITVSVGILITRPAFADILRKIQE